MVNSGGAIVVPWPGAYCAVSFRSKRSSEAVPKIPAVLRRSTVSPIFVARGVEGKRITY